MAYKIEKEDCVNCGACETVCPVAAISEVEDKRFIDAETCIDCGACAEACPVDCIESGN